MMETDFERMRGMEERGGIEWLSYGLAPNPWGYCYEIVDEEMYESLSEKEKKEIELLADVAPIGYLE